MKNPLPVLLFAGLLTSCSGESNSSYPQEAAKTEASAPVKVVCDIQALAGKTAKEVQKLYGKPDASKPETVRAGPCKSKHCTSSTYQNGRIEVVYINDKADWITVNEVTGQSLNANAIQLLGLPVTSPSFNNPSNVIRWSLVKGLYEVSAFSNGSGGISYFHILSKTPL
jgi:hypothetical protein